MWAMGLAITGIVAFIGVLLGINGYFAGRHLDSIDTKLDCLPKMQEQIIEMRTEQKHHSEKQEEFCSRLERVETTISNTERITVLEKVVDQLGEEKAYARQHRHWVAGALQAICHETKIKIDPQP